MVSLDGFIEGPENDINWHVWNDDMNHFMVEFFKRVDTILFGRRTYELMLTYWPNATSEDPVITENMNNLAKIVFSRTLDKVEWNSSLIHDNISEEIIRLKQQDGKDMVIFGGANLASVFINMDLIDEYQLIINPVVLGKGTSLFQNTNDLLNMKLLETRSFSCGNVLLRYAPVKQGVQNEIQSKVEEATSELLHLISSLTTEQLNQKPDGGGWSAGQVGEHLLKSYGVVELLRGRTKPTTRPIDEKIQELKSVFLNFDIKLESPEFIIPSEKHIERDVLLERLGEKINAIVGFSKEHDLSATCLDFELPGTGAMTKLEWLHFVTYHTQRHNHQMKKIIEKVSESKQPDPTPR